MVFFPLNGIADHGLLKVFASCELVGIKAIGNSTLGPFLDGPADTTDLRECVEFVHIDETTAHEAVEHRDTVVIVL